MEFVQNNLVYVVLAIVSGGMLLWQTFRGVSAGDQITPHQATLMMNREDAIVIDVRGSAEWTAGHIAGARHIPMDQIEKHLSELEKFKTQPLIVNCQIGGRSGSACRLLKKRGFERVFSLSGGLDAWREAGLPLTIK